MQVVDVWKKWVKLFLFLYLNNLNKLSLERSTGIGIAWEAWRMAKEVGQM